ncbi:MAG: prolipoprotein diacylglyceryl transferase [Candidatus Doudnabacteria bacterium RIFCSPLOWO2_01_FULL_44_21]|uniref:Phosphatidylglycerol--prolipoprotein diacylglyceryl transferase n=1 Tax=Candidatus Doudnabacteria bacterium RIFCSPLOWO2_01_FULL_44_21 TaxID=1817841 RepID=A0A1F5PXP2_9BACT|nr:MAG: prolipoprotein diacylglyceryl transferase [Candidatus Doudnabacteria bacterium RIFCSPHIGHO2_02_FULL_43_13b]OGE94686.1 MAG: prolipoprotein diacylglyceryl transferase [Candidatus Doudnabacteria bacterium RIFCSPLOWO2_01_FULL_44_21]
MFVPAFQGKLVIDPIIHLGPLSIRWYGLILAASILTGYFIIRKNSWKFGISAKDIDDFAFWLVIVAVVGARIYFVLFNWAYFSQNLAEIYKIWYGGISIYGSLIAGVIFSYFYTRKAAYSFWQLTDLLALGLPLSQAIGRLGNFVNQEAYGTHTNLPWKMYVAAKQDYVHPTFLYEAVANVLVFVVLKKMIGKFKPGVLVLTYFMAYSVIRFVVEGLRTDSLYISIFRVDQIVAVIILLISGLLLWMRSKH